MFNKKEWEKQYYKDNRRKRLRYQKQWSQDNPEKRRANRFKLAYNLSHEEWLRMWKDQDGKCLICRKIFNEPSDAYVDHNHETGKVRGLLCPKCNIGIGLFDDNPKLMIRAIKYLGGKFGDTEEK